MTHAVDPTRRALLTGRWRGPPPTRPPWSLAEDRFTVGCTRCNACLDACPEGILVPGPGGFPTVDFRRGECTFCRACADACPATLFNPVTEPPWTLRATIGDGCLARQGVVCQSCGEVCEAGAIRFRPRLGGPSLPALELDACTGCGACVRGCPTQAITVAAP